MDVPSVSGRYLGRTRASARQGRARHRRTQVFSFALLNACPRRWVYNRSMVRKYASFAFGLALIVALGFAMAHAHALKIPGASTGFSAPCEPASPVFKAASELKAVSPIDSTYAAENAEASTGVARRSYVETVARAITLPAPRAFPPLFHRPPPANS